MNRFSVENLFVMLITEQSMRFERNSTTEHREPSFASTGIMKTINLEAGKAITHKHTDTDTQTVHRLVLIHISTKVRKNESHS